MYPLSGKGLGALLGGYAFETYGAVTLPFMFRRIRYSRRHLRHAPPVL